MSQVAQLSRPWNDDEVKTLVQIRLLKPERLANQPLGAIPTNGIAKSATDLYSQANVTAAVLERVQNKKTIGRTAPQLKRAVEVMLEANAL